MNLFEFLNENYYMLVPALWVIGYALKQTPKVPDWTIIWILLIVSIVLGSLAFGFSIIGLMNGMIAAGVAVFGHQMVKQTLKGKQEKKDILPEEPEDRNEEEKIKKGRRR